MRRRAAVAAALTGAALLGTVADAQDQARRATLTVRPVLCITDRREESCPVSVLVVWRSEGAGDYCLHSDLVDGPIRCWQRAVSGMLMEDVLVQQTFDYWLTDGASRARLAEATLDVLTTDSDDRRRNRRRRHVWDIL